jgi:hypothetical protein
MSKIRVLIIAEIGGVVSIIYVHTINISNRELSCLPRGFARYPINFGQTRGGRFEGFVARRVKAVKNELQKNTMWLQIPSLNSNKPTTNHTDDSDLLALHWFNPTTTDMNVIIQNRTLARLPQRGFALIVTLSLMILLTVIAVGLLTLSSISLRSAGQNAAISTAQGNARMALTLAIGELQKNAGPDQRVTARADVLDSTPSSSSSNPRLTGVWKSWEILASSPPTATEYERSARDQRFLGWLTSSLDNQAALINYAKDTSLTTTGVNAPAVALWDKGSLGPAATANDIVKAEKVPTTTSRGAYAWAVMDEGVKVRINTPYQDAATTKGAQSAQLGSGERPNTSAITGLEKLERSNFEFGSTGMGIIDKGVTMPNLQLAAENLAAGTLLKPLTHDVTPSSVGLFTDTARGGLKEDFNLLTNKAILPARYRGTGVYSSLLGVPNAGNSQPRWESFHELARLYQDGNRLTMLDGAPTLSARGPNGWQAATDSDAASGKTGNPVRNAPAGLTLFPTIAKVQVVFSLMVRDIYNYPSTGDGLGKPDGASQADERGQQLHNPFGNNFAGSAYDYLLHMIYTPVVTLHNPYNVALEFNDLKVMFGNVPFAMQVIRSGTAMTPDLMPLDQLFTGNAGGGISKRFGLKLRTNGGSANAPAVGVPNFRLLPGEVVMFSPYFDPARTWAVEARAANRTFWDWQGDNNKSLAIDAIPGWRGAAIGFDLDWFRPGLSGDIPNGLALGCIAARRTDTFSVKFAPFSIDAAANKFSVEMFATPVGASAQISSGIIQMDYGSQKGLQEKLLGAGGTLTYPETNTIGAMQMHSHSTTPSGAISNVKPFAVLSAQAKTTRGGMDLAAQDGKIATKPWSFAHAVGSVSVPQLITEHGANNSHEIDIQLLNIAQGADDLFPLERVTGRSSFISGRTKNTGIKFGSMYDIPIAPLQTLASLNSANPGGASGFLPRFAQPIGNSWAHPFLNPGTPVSGVGDSSLLDHSFLLNLALYDRFYFSGLANQTGPNGTGRDSAALAGDFLAGQPLVDPRLTLRVPAGKVRTDFTADVASDDAQTRIAAWQVMNGAFNINSTSVMAWKAMLGSIHDSQAVVNRLNKPGKTSSLVNQQPASNQTSHISRFRLPVESDLIQENYWLGTREYTDAQLELLAEKIVEQVRLRGPFLSMSEFVNRRLGSASDPLSQRGALQQAIDNTNINQAYATNAGAGFDILPGAVGDYQYKNPLAGTGPSYQGAPGYLTQADLLNVLGNAATPRSDTFTIRTYGEARDAQDKPIATAVCEAVIQRVPDYVDPADTPEIPTLSLTSQANINFGRRFTIVSFRWLTANEI